MMPREFNRQPLRDAINRGLKNLAWPPLQSLAVKKKLFFVQILGGEKLLKFVEKSLSAGEIFLSGLRGAKKNSVAFRMVFRFFGGSFVLQTCRPKKMSTNFFCANFSGTPTESGMSRQIPQISQRRSLLGWSPMSAKECLGLPGQVRDMRFFCSSLLLRTYFSVTRSYLGTTRVARIRSDCPKPQKIDFRNPIIALIDFESQFLQSEQSEQLGLQYWTSKIKNCNPSNPNRAFQSEQSRVNY